MRPDRGGGLHRKGTMPRVLYSAVYVFIPYVVYNIPVSFQQTELATLRGSLGENESVGTGARSPRPCDGRVVVNFRIVAQFVIERELPGAGALSDTQIREISLRSLQALKDVGPQIQWLHSYVTEDKVYCVYLAPDEDTVREHARRAGIPADRVSAVRRLIDPANLN